MFWACFYLNDCVGKVSSNCKHSSSFGLALTISLTFSKTHLWNIYNKLSSFSSNKNSYRHCATITESQLKTMKTRFSCIKKASGNTRKQSNELRRWKIKSLRQWEKLKTRKTDCQTCLFGWNIAQILDMSQGLSWLCQHCLWTQCFALLIFL